MGCALCMLLAKNNIFECLHETLSVIQCYLEMQSCCKEYKWFTFF